MHNYAHHYGEALYQKKEALHQTEGALYPKKKHYTREAAAVDSRHLRDEASQTDAGRQAEYFVQSSRKLFSLLYNRVMPNKICRSHLVQ